MSRSAYALPLAGVGAATLLAYAPALSAPFQFDDYARLFDNPALPAGDWWTAVLWLGGARLLPSLTLVANYAIGGESPIGYHAVNVAAHLLATAGVFTLVTLLARAPRLADSALAAHPRAAATAAALCFGCHPLQTQAVTYVVQRSAVFAGLFSIWAVVCYLRARLASPSRDRGRLARRAARDAVPTGRPHAATRWYLASLLLAVCAVLSKENAACLPLLVLLVEWIAVGGRPSRRRLMRGALIVALLLLVPLGWKLATWRPLLAGPQPPSLDERLRGVFLAAGDGQPALTPLTYARTQGVVVPRYLALVALPWGLNVDHDVPIAAALTPAVAAGALLLAALLAAALAAARRAPLLGLGMLWVFAALALESSLLPIPDVMMEHRMYLAMPGVALIAAQAAAWGRGRAPRATTAATAGLAAALVSLTFARNLVWQSPLTLWLDAAGKSPDKARVQLNLGVALHGSGQIADAAQHYCRALTLDPGMAVAAENLAIARDQLGRAPDLPCDPQPAQPVYGQ